MRPRGSLKVTKTRKEKIMENFLKNAINYTKKLAHKLSKPPITSKPGNRAIKPP
jgi:hypothetical protein